jgi:hypothetical protein
MVPPGSEEKMKKKKEKKPKKVKVKVPKQKRGKKAFSSPALMRKVRAYA